jgi:hypothetical protein
MRHICGRVLALVAVAALLSSPAATARLTAEHVESDDRDQGRPADTNGPAPLADEGSNTLIEAWKSRQES